MTGENHKLNDDRNCPTPTQDEPPYYRGMMTVASSIPPPKLVAPKEPFCINPNLTNPTLAFQPPNQLECVFFPNNIPNQNYMSHQRNYHPGLHSSCNQPPVTHPTQSYSFQSNYYQPNLHHRSSSVRSRSRSPPNSRQSRCIVDLSTKDSQQGGIPLSLANHVTLYSTTLWIGHLPSLTSKMDLNEIFSQYGKVTSIVVCILLFLITLCNILLHCLYCRWFQKNTVHLCV